MKAIILCAGYATRLYPLTLHTPKPLLPVGGKPLLDYLLERVEEISEVEDVYLVTNARFRQHFADWIAKARFSKKIMLLHDATMSYEDRLGAIRDLELAISRGPIREDILVMAGDNLFNSSILNFVRAGLKNRPAITVGAVDIQSRELARRYGVLRLDGKGQMVEFLEKPEHPPSSLVSMGLYFLPAEKLGTIQDYLASGENPDAPGFFIHWLLKKETLYGHVFEGVWYDIGDLASYESADKLFGSLAREKQARSCG